MEKFTNTLQVFPYETYINNKYISKLKEVNRNKR